MSENHPEHVFMKVKWQLIAAVDRHNKYQFLIVGHCEPDIARNARSLLVHLATQKRLPAVWNN